MHHMNINGLGVAIVTPFNSDKSIDFEALNRVLSHLIENNVDYIVVLGTTGETPALSRKEIETVRAFAVEKTMGRVPLVLGLGGNNTMAIVNDLKESDLSGYSAILSVVPYYNKPTQEGIFQHYKAVADASPLPIILYNVPGRTGVNMTAETTLRIANACPNVIGVKEASGDIKQIEEILNNKPSNFQVVSGDDALTCHLMEKGADGIISVVGNAFPARFGIMVKHCATGDFSSAHAIEAEFEELIPKLFAQGNPAGIKASLSALGMISNELRLPLVPVCEELYAEIAELSQKISKL